MRACRYLLGDPVSLFIWTPRTPNYLDALYPYLFGRPVPLFIGTPCTPIYWDTLYPFLLGHPVPLFIGTHWTHIYFEPHRDSVYWETLIYENTLLFCLHPETIIIGTPCTHVFRTPCTPIYWNTLYLCLLEHPVPMGWTPPYPRYKKNTTANKEWYRLNTEHKSIEEGTKSSKYKPQSIYWEELNGLNTNFVKHRVYIKRN